MKRKKVKDKKRKFLEFENAFYFQSAYQFFW